MPAPRGLEAVTLSIAGDDYVAFSFFVPEAGLPGELTEAERAVVRGVLEGRSNAAIAFDRGTSTRTVANQLRSVSAKLGVSGRVELIRWCLSQRRLGAER